MFNAPFVPDLSRRIVGPLAVQYAFEASPKWHAQNPGSMDAIGNLLLQRYTVEIHNWLQGARHNARMSNLPVWRSRYTLPGITAEYIRSSRSESLRLVAQPESAGDRIPTTITVSPGEIIDVRASFNGWPIPGYPADVNLITGDTQYWWDFASTPGAPNLNGPIPQGGTGGVDWPLIDWQSVKAGSRIVPQALAGKQYWEVEILELPSDVPGPVTKSFSGGVNDGTFTQSEVFFSNVNVLQRFFPRALNTFFTPQIGVVPEVSLAKNTNGKGFKTTTPTLMGLAEVGANTGSVFVTRSSFMQGHVTIHTPSADYIDIAYGDGSHSLVGAGTKPAGDKLWHSGDIVVSGSSVFMFQIAVQATGPGAGFHTSWTGPNSGPPAGSTWGVSSGGYYTLIPWPAGDVNGANVDGQYWSLIGTVGGSAYDKPTSPISTYPHTPTGTSFPIFWPTVGQAPQPLSGSSITRLTAHGADDETALVTYGDTMLSGALMDSTPGKKAPVLHTGRLDLDGGPVGLDLGDIVVGDVVMIATELLTKKQFDTQSSPQVSGKIWFGKNGKWYNWTGSPTSPNVDAVMDVANGWASVLDPIWDVNSGLVIGQAKFYPAVSWRLGPVHVRIRLGTSQKHKPPKGFKALTQGPSDFTIPGPSKIA